MSITVYGCVAFPVGTITFENLETCLAQSACMVFTGIHAGQVALTLSGADDPACNDTFYGCINFSTGKFQVEIPTDCCALIFVGTTLSPVHNLKTNCSYNYEYGSPANRTYFMLILGLGYPYFIAGHLFFCKVNSDFGLLWQYNVIFDYISQECAYYGKKIQMDSEGYIYTLGRDVEGYNLHKLQDNGTSYTLIWRRQIVVGTYLDTIGLWVDANNFIYVAHSNYIIDSVAYSVTKLDKNGNIIFRIPTPSPVAGANDIIVLSNENIVVGYNPKTVKVYNKYGSEINSIILTGTNVVICEIRRDNQDNLLIGAFVRLIKLTSNLVEVCFFPSPQNYSMMGLDVDKEGNVYTTYDMQKVVKLDSACSKLCENSPGGYLTTITFAPGLTKVHISDCLASLVSCEPPDPPKKRVEVRFRVLDSNDIPIERSIVGFNYNGIITGNGSLLTDATGWGTAYSDCVCENGDVTFTVINIQGIGLQYNPIANVCSSACCNLIC